MTPFAVTQRAARLAPELDALARTLLDDRIDGAELAPIATEDVLRALWRAGLTLDADLSHPGVVLAALRRIGHGPTGPIEKKR